MIRVFIADDHDIVRAGLRGLLDQVPDMSVCGEVDNVPALLEALPAVRADVVVLDVNMPGNKGPKTVEAILSLPKAPKVVVFTMYREDDHAVPFLRAGACAFVSKRRSSMELLRAIRECHEGHTYLSPEVADRLAGQGIDLDTGNEPGLTARELQVIRLLAEGHRSVRIAEEMGVTASTVNTHVQHIKQKLGLSSLVDIVRHAEKNGYLLPDDEVT